MEIPWKTKEEFLEDAKKKGKDAPIEPLPFNESLIDLFSTVREWQDGIRLDLELVKGSVHPDYAGRSWLWLLENGKRMDHNLCLLIENPVYYFEETKKLPAMSYLAVGNAYYVYTDGNHRTCIARFLFQLLGLDPVLSGVEVVRKEIDIEALRAFEKLKSRGASVMVSRKKTAREDGAGWMREHYMLRFSVVERGKLYEDLSREDFLALANERKKKSFFALLGSLLKCHL